MDREKVMWEWRCRNCDEQHIDKLVWSEDGDYVECQTCGAKYRPHQDGVIIQEAT